MATPVRGSAYKLSRRTNSRGLEGCQLVSSVSLGVMSVAYVYYNCSDGLHVRDAGFQIYGSFLSRPAVDLMVDDHWRAMYRVVVQWFMIYWYI